MKCRGLFLISILCLVPSTAAWASPQTPREVIADIRVHGNQVSSDEDIVNLAGVKIGDAVLAGMFTQIAERLRATHRFDRVDVLKRLASITDPSQIVVVIIVDEGPVRIQLPAIPGGKAVMMRRRGLGNLMFLPILDSEDGYGVTYGARFAFAKVAGNQSRLSFPATWGGERQVAAELEKNFKSRAITRVELGAGLAQRTNPFYQTDDTRRRVWGRVERAVGPLRLGANLGWQHVGFAGATDTFRSVGGDVTFDTRLDPFLPRNAVYLHADWQRLFFAGAPAATLRSYDGRAYVGLLGQTVLVLRAVRNDSDRALPGYLKPLLGGVTNLRGFDAGTEAGDTLVAGSAELRVPLTTPLEVGKLGVSLFVDTGAAYDYGQRLRDQDRKTGVGGAVWLAAAVFHMSLSVAHGLGAHTRVQFDIGIGF